MEYKKFNLNNKSSKSKEYKFDIGDWVGFKNFFKNHGLAIIRGYYSNNALGNYSKNAYVVEIVNTGERHILLEEDMFLRGLKRIVMIEKCFYSIKNKHIFDLDDNGVWIQ